MQKAARLADPSPAANRNYAEQWLGGKDAGELCDDERANPVVYAAGAAPPRL